MINKVAVLIPVYKPMGVLTDLVAELNKIGITNIIIVKDCAIKGYEKIFEDLVNMGCSLVEHKVNLGKGRALKTGINYYLTNDKFKDFKGIVTADADYQHVPSDIMKVLKSVLENSDHLTLGVRQFKGNVPLRSRLGNLITRKLFAFLVGKKISDTQTGLRGIPNQYMEDFLKVSGERYEYEMNMLIATKKLNISIMEIPITTVYIDNNASSHFNPILDSIRIYSLLCGFAMSALASFVLDYLLFVMIFQLTASLGIASYGSRSISIFVNYSINKKVVFANKKKYSSAMLQYLLLAMFSITVSYFALRFLHLNFQADIFVTKLILEFMLFFFNFYVQNRFIFNSNVRCNKAKKYS